ncbi:MULTISPECIES: 3-oxoacyl-[acyl-carrier-protein] synthase III C-terminal domain-containing protein [Burkholderia]|nr:MULTISPECIES: 3-oxoacyl-[acyl-carrier-protein] synthase III C-terminal domain-containing protein [Burkholderia]
MSHPIDLAGIEPRIVATARYIPSTRLSPDTRIELHASTHRARETVMQAVYADTLRWRDSVAPAATSSDSRSGAGFAAGGVVAAEPCLSLSDMALTAAQTLIAALPPAQTAPPDQIIVCANSFEHDLALSCACRLHHALGSNRSPFAIGLLHGVSPLMALDAAMALMAADTQLSTILIVAAERWRAPFSRRVGALAVLSDGAAALLVARRPGPGWCVRHLSIQTPCGAYPLATETNYVDTVTLAHVIGETCARVELGPAELDWIVPAAINPRLIHEVSVRCALPAERVWADEDAPGCFGVADLPVRLDGLLRSIAPVSHQHMLVWSAGFQGQVGCALLEFCGDAP